MPRCARSGRRRRPPPAGPLVRRPLPGRAGRREHPLQARRDPVGSPASASAGRDVVDQRVEHLARRPQLAAARVARSVVGQRRSARPASGSAQRLGAPAVGTAGSRPVARPPSPRAPATSAATSSRVARGRCRVEDPHLDASGGRRRAGRRSRASRRRGRRRLAIRNRCRPAVAAPPSRTPRSGRRSASVATAGSATTRSRCRGRRRTASWRSSATSTGSHGAIRSMQRDALLVGVDRDVDVHAAGASPRRATCAEGRRPCRGSGRCR